MVISASKKVGFLKLGFELFLSLIFVEIWGIMMVNDSSGSLHTDEVNTGSRFEFGKNWQRFLSLLTAERIKKAEESLCEMLNCSDLKDKTFLDIGCGSGLFSLAAKNIGAKVVSFDFDPSSVACARGLKQKYYQDDPGWAILEGSVLNNEFLDGLGKFDIVYSWGVLHHTGKMWEAIKNATKLVDSKGLFFIAIYNDQGKWSTYWNRIKKFYCSSVLGKAIISCIFFPFFSLKFAISSVLEGRNKFTEYRQNRGMSVIHDWRDWLGGFPFEYASVEKIFDYMKLLNFSMIRVKDCNGLGNNQFVFQNNN